MKITIIGCGNMGTAFATRLSTDHFLYLYDRHFEKSQKLQDDGYGTAVQDLEKALQDSELIILAVKPQSLNQVVDAFPTKLPQEQLLVSLLTGTSLEQLKKYFPDQTVVRIMPNLAVVCGAGLLGIAVDSPLSEKKQNQIITLCDPLGKVYWLEERKMNAFTALAGSGPAFVFALIESMIESGISLGFSAKDAQNIVLQMMKGSLELLEQSKKHPGELKWQITSPAGTTIAGLKKFEEEAVRGSIINTFLATYNRAIELTE